MEHTPEPWRITMGAYWLRIIGPSKQAITSFGNQRRWMNQKEVEANARRIVACVNACEGINPEAVPELLAACEAANAFMESVIEYNEMRGAESPPDVIEIHGQLQSAIAKAKGEPCT